MLSHVHSIVSMYSSYLPILTSLSHLLSCWPKCLKVRLSTTPGHLWIYTGKLVGKPAGQMTCGSRSLYSTGLHRSGYEIFHNKYLSQVPAFLQLVGLHRSTCENLWVKWLISINGPHWHPFEYASPLPSSYNLTQWHTYPNTLILTPLS